MALYQSMVVTVLRAAMAADDGYNPSVEQLLIRTWDGVERAVATVEVTLDPPLAFPGEGKEIVGRREREYGFNTNNQADRALGAFTER